MAFGVKRANGLLMILPILAIGSVPDLTDRSVETRDVWLRERSVCKLVSTRPLMAEWKTYAIEGVNECIVNEEVLAEHREDGRALADYNRTRLRRALDMR
jgi:hypothetical protein